MTKEYFEMHMADALISPVVGGTMWAVSGGLIAWCARKVRQAMDDRIVPMMGVLGAFIFTAQMINFSIPVTGSSGHLGGGMLLAILLGPYAAFIVIASVLTVQALFFADGGLLALGSNIFNLGFLPVFIAYPLIFRPIAGGAKTGVRFLTGVLLASIIGLQLGAFGVVMETTLSGVSDLPFKTFVMLMQPIHLAIGLVEGLVTVAVAAVVMRASHLGGVETPRTGGMGNLRGAALGLLVVTIITGGVLSWFSSTNPDGLEWAMTRLSGKEELDAQSTGAHQSLRNIQDKTAFLPDYDFKRSASLKPEGAVKTEFMQAPGRTAVNPGKSAAGLLGGFITLVLAVLIGYGLKANK